MKDRSFSQKLWYWSTVLKDSLMNAFRSFLFVFFFFAFSLCVFLSIFKRDWLLKLKTIWNVFLNYQSVSEIPSVEILVNIRKATKQHSAPNFQDDAFRILSQSFYEVAYSSLNFCRRNNFTTRWIIKTIN